MNQDKLNSIIRTVIAVPRNFASRGNMSVHALLMESGYFEAHQLVTEPDIHAALQKNPDCVEDWLGWSDDKRTPAGWFFRQTGIGTYEVACIPPQEGLATEFSDALLACAVFIKREIESVRTGAKR